MALPPDRFQLVSLLGSSRFKGAALIRELAQSGLPYQVAGSAGDAVRLGAQLATQLFLDDDQFAKLSPELVAQLEVMQRQQRMNVIVIGATTPIASRGTLSFHHLDGSTPLDTLLPVLVPRMLMHQRGTPRASVTLNARFESGVRDEAIDGRVNSLSEGGVLFVAQSPPALGETGMLTVTDENGEWEVRATVMNERKLERGAGMKFEGASEATRARIRQTVNRTLGGGSRRDVKQKIMSLDTSMLSSRLTEAIFLGAGYDVQLTHSPAEAAKALAASKPDLLLLDHSASILAGERTKEIVRRAQGITVVFYSNADEASIKAAQQLAGVTQHVYKGTFADSLVTRISALMR